MNPDGKMVGQVLERLNGHSCSKVPCRPDYRIQKSGSCSKRSRLVSTCVPAVPAPACFKALKSGLLVPKYRC